MRHIFSRQFNLLIVSPILADRTLCRLFSGMMLVHLGFVKLGIPSWPCPFRHSLGIPCPGCGLSRAILDFCQGHWRQAVLIHAFAPIVLVFLLLVAAIAIFPANFQHFWVRNLRKLEERTRFSMFLVLALLSYWIIRLFFFRDLFYQLVL
jgi:hypothetical protein